MLRVPDVLHRPCRCSKAILLADHLALIQADESFGFCRFRQLTEILKDSKNKIIWLPLSVSDVARVHESIRAMKPSAASLPETQPGTQRLDPAPGRPSHSETRGTHTSAQSHHWDGGLTRQLKQPPPLHRAGGPTGPRPSGSEQREEGAHIDDLQRRWVQPLALLHHFARHRFVDLVTNHRVAHDVVLEL